MVAERGIFDVSSGVIAVAVTTDGPEACALSETEKKRPLSPCYQLTDALLSGSNLFIDISASFGSISYPLVPSHE